VEHDPRIVPIGDIVRAGQRQITLAPLPGGNLLPLRGHGVVGRFIDLHLIRLPALNVLVGGGDPLARVILRGGQPRAAEHQHCQNGEQSYAIQTTIHVLLSYPSVSVSSSSASSSGGALMAAGSFRPVKRSALTLSCARDISAPASV